MKTFEFKGSSEPKASAILATTSHDNSMFDLPIMLPFSKRAFLYLLPQITLLFSMAASSIILFGQMVISLSIDTSSPILHPSAKIIPAFAFTFLPMILSLQITQLSRLQFLSIKTFSQITLFLILLFSFIVVFSPITTFSSLQPFSILTFLPKITFPFI